MRHAVLRPILFAALGIWALALGDIASALPVAYTSRAAFDSALGGVTVLDFESETAPTTIPSGGSVGGVTFTYALSGGAQLLVSDQFDTTSPANFLGSDVFDLLAANDDFSMSFGPVNGIGLYIISADEPGVFILDGDIQLGISSGTAFLDVDAVEFQLPDEANVYFLGIIDPDTTFTGASLTTFGSTYFYNVDDIVTGIAPEPGSALLLAAGLLGLASRRVRR